MATAAFEGILREIPGLYASEDLSSYQFCFVYISGDGTVAHSAHNAQSIGVLQNKPSASGQAAVVAGPGSVTKLKITDSITAGYMLAPDASGNATGIHATTSDYPAAIALIGGSTGDTIPVEVIQATKAL